MVRNNGKSAEHSAMEKLLSDLQGHPLAWAFLQPVNGEEVADYYEVIKQPMGKFPRGTNDVAVQGPTDAPRGPRSHYSMTDFATMEHKLDTNQYPNLDLFLTDAQLVFDNCRTYNAEGSLYHKNATKLEKFLKDQVHSLKLKKEY